MTQTKEERFEYWRGRLFDRIKSFGGQYELDLKWILENANHIDMDTTDIVKAFMDISLGLDNLKEAIKHGKEKVAEETPVTSSVKKGEPAPGVPIDMTKVDEKVDVSVVTPEENNENSTETVQSSTDSK